MYKEEELWTLCELDPFETPAVPVFQLTRCLSLASTNSLWPQLNLQKMSAALLNL